MYLNPLSRSRMSRIAWSLFRHPVKCRQYPAQAERLRKQAFADVVAHFSERQMVAEHERIYRDLCGRSAGQNVS